jgi:IclR family transcriptional regulator, pca regulon regulatory protein
MTGSIEKDSRKINNKPGMFNSSVEKCVRVLQAFDEGHLSLSLSQLIAITGLEKSAARRFIFTLVTLGFLKRHSETKQYSLSPRVLTLGASYIRTNPLINRATPYLLAWNKEHEENVHLAELDGTDIIHVARFRSRDVVSAEIGIGSCFPWYIGSLGQAIVAFLPVEERVEIINSTKFIRYASKTKLNAAQIDHKLKKVRQVGYSLTHRESFENEISIAAPIFGGAGKVIAAVGTAVLETHWSVKDARSKLAPPIVDLSQALSQDWKMFFERDHR